MPADLAAQTPQTIGATQLANLAQLADLSTDLNELTDKDIEALAALEGAPAGVATLALSSVSSQLHDWAQRHRLIVTDQAGQPPHLTDQGYALISLAATKIHQPFSDVSFDDLRVETQKLLQALPDI